MTDKSTGTMQVDIKLVRQLAELLDETKLSEIEVEDGGRKIRVARAMSAVAAPVQMAAPAPLAAAPAVAAAAVPAADHPGTVKSPMVGTVYLSASPEAAPFAPVGTIVSEGDTLLIIEAMKVMNPILAPRAGKVIQVIVDNGQPVEFDQPLVIVE
jgi:acetyl-CoA carboxylase biotin carboxyl carrier protein